MKQRVAFILQQENDIWSVQISLTQCVKNRCPSTVSCATPLVTISQSKKIHQLPICLLRCCLTRGFIQQFVFRSRSIYCQFAFWLITRFHSMFVYYLDAASSKLFNHFLCGTLLKTFWKSKYTASTGSLLYILLIKSSKIFSRKSNAIFHS